MALFEIRNLTFTYPDQEKPALTDLNFSLKQGEFLVAVSYTHLTLPTKLEV